MLKKIKDKKIKRHAEIGRDYFLLVIKMFTREKIIKEEIRKKIKEKIKS